MQKSEQLETLQKDLQTIKETADTLEIDVEKLRVIISEEQFIPYDLNKAIRDKLLELNNLQKKFETEYLSLGIGSVPEKISRASEAIDIASQDLKTRQRIEDVIKDFLRMRSNNKEIKNGLEIKQNEIRNYIKEDKLTEDDIANIEKLLAAYKEEDMSLKFNMILELSSYFDSKILFGMNTGQILFRDKLKDDDISLFNKNVQANLTERKPEEEIKAETDEEGEHAGAEETDELKEASNNTLTTVVLEEAENENPFKYDVAWEDLGITEPDAFISDESKYSLTIETAPKAEKKFGVKEFKGDIAKYPTEHKIKCLEMIESYTGITPETLAIYLDEPKNVNLAASVIDKLYRMGYLAKYNIDSYEPIYFLSDRGKKIYSSKEALRFMDVECDNAICSDGYTYEVEETDGKVNSILSEHCNSAAYKLFNKLYGMSGYIDFYMTGGYMNYMDLSFEIQGPIPAVFLDDDEIIKDKTNIPKSGKHITFITTTCTTADEYAHLLNDLRLDEETREKENISPCPLYVVIHPVKEQAKKIACWLKENFNDKQFGYADAKDLNVYDIFTDEKWPSENEDPDPEPEKDTDDNEKDDLIADENKEQPSGSETQIEEKAEIKADDSNAIKNDAVTEVDEVSASSDTEKEYEDEEEPAESITEIATDKEEKEIKVDKETLRKHTEAYLTMLSNEKYYAATAYLKSVSKGIPAFKNIYQQLAYALNDPMASCTYSSAQIFDTYFSSAESVSDYFTIAAVLRNYFYDQYSYDYTLKQLHSAVISNSTFEKYPSLERVVYNLMCFKNDHHCGIDKYADYHEKERAQFEHRLDGLRAKAQSYYDNYVLNKLKENASHKRFIETRRIIFDPNGEIAEYLKIVIDGTKEIDMITLLTDYVKNAFVKENATICSENVDPEKIDIIIDDAWNRAADKLRLVKKTSDLMSSLRMNLFKLIKKNADVLCDYVAIMKNVDMGEDDPVLPAYKKTKKVLLEDMKNVLNEINEDEDKNNKGEKYVLSKTIKELLSRLEGDYDETANKYYYIDFLRTSDVILGDDYMPELNTIIELPCLSAENRIVAHTMKTSSSWNDRLEEIFSGQDDYGSAKLIIDYAYNTGTKIDEQYTHTFDFDKAVAYPRKDMENKKTEFIEDLELAQSYGQIDNTVEDQKETIIQIMELWHGWALETQNFGFFGMLLEAFANKIKVDSQARAEDLSKTLESYLASDAYDESDENAAKVVSQIKARIKQANYAAAEDLLNRLEENDIYTNNNDDVTDYLQMFLDEYDVISRKTANAGATLRSLVKMPKDRKDERGAEKLLDSWPRGHKVGEGKTRDLLSSLGFNPDEIKAHSDINGKIENYTVTLKKPENGRKSNYKHPIAVFGSKAEDKGFRVVYLFGKMDADVLIDTCKEIGNAKDTLIFLDYALTLPERRKLARKMKTDLNNKVFGIVDRVAFAWLATHYVETAINRMLMSIILPFTYHQPYIDKSVDIMPPEIFMGRKNELQQIEEPNGVNIVYGGRQLGKSALLRQAQKDINLNENGDRALIVDIKGMDYKKAAKQISMALYDEGIVMTENITEDWDILARDIKNRLRDSENKIPYLLLLLDEADSFIESCEEVGYKPFDAMKDIQSIGDGRFKFVVAGLRNIVRFKKNIALGNNSVLTHLKSLTVTPFKSTEARELLEEPLHYLGFRFENNTETEVLISTILGTTNYFPGLLQLYSSRLIEAMKKDYAGYAENDTPPYIISKDHIKKVLAEQGLQQEIREKFFITLKVDEDDYYYILALLTAYHYHENRDQNGCSVKDIMSLAKAFEISKISSLGEEKVAALMEEMRELNVLQLTGGNRYRFARHSFCQMMGTISQLDDELYKYMEV